MDAHVSHRGRRDWRGHDPTLLKERDSLRAKAVEDSLRRASDAVALADGKRRVASDTGLAAPTIPAVVRNLSKGVVYLQFYGKGDERRDRRAMEALRLALKDAGFVAPGVDSVSTRVANSVRFFNDGDAAAAEDVASIVARLLPSLGRVPVTRRRQSGGEGLIEVWLDLTSVADSALAARS